jgi:hypothetical protein
LTRVPHRSIIDLLAITRRLITGPHPEQGIQLSLFPAFEPEELLCRKIFNPLNLYGRRFRNRNDSFLPYQGALGPADAIRSVSRDTMVPHPSTPTTWNEFLTMMSTRSIAGCACYSGLLGSDAPHKDRLLLERKHGRTIPFLAYMGCCLFSPR